MAMTFHDQCCRYPEAAVMKEAKRHLTGLVNSLCNDMKTRNVAQHIHFQGSSYEGLKTLASELEFDCLIVLKGKAIMAAGLNPAGYTKLKCNGQGLSVDKMCEDGMLSPQKIRNKFQSELQKSINNTGRSGYLKLVSHGPAIQIDVYHDWGIKQDKWYSVDMVPGFHVKVPSEYQIFVAKPYKPSGYGLVSAGAHLTWRRSYSMEETKKFKNIDRGSQCRKMVDRMIKVMCEIDAPLKALPSYMIKTVVMNLDRDPNLEWGMWCLGLRFVDVLSQLRDHLSSGHLPHHFLDGSNGLDPLNLLVDMNRAVLGPMAGRLRNLLNSQDKMTAMLTRTLDDRTQFCSSSAVCRTDSSYGETYESGYGDYRRQASESSSEDEDLQNYKTTDWSPRGSTSIQGESVDLSGLLGGVGAALFGAVAGGAAATGVYAAGRMHEREEQRKRINSSDGRWGSRGRQNETTEGITPDEVMGGLAAAGLGALVGGIAALGAYAMSDGDPKSNKK